MLRPAQPARAAPDSRRWRCAQADARAKEAKLKAAQAGGFGDVSIAAQAYLETMSFSELMLMAKHGELIDGHLTVAKMTGIFALVNNMAADDGDKDDDDADELSFAEFKNCICRGLALFSSTGHCCGLSWCGLVNAATMAGAQPSGVCDVRVHNTAEEEPRSLTLWQQHLQDTEQPLPNRQMQYGVTSNTPAI